MDCEINVESGEEEKKEKNSTKVVRIEGKQRNFYATTSEVKRVLISERLNIERGTEQYQGENSPLPFFGHRTATLTLLEPSKHRDYTTQAEPHRYPKGSPLYSYKIR